MSGALNMKSISSAPMSVVLVAVLAAVAMVPRGSSADEKSSSALREPVAWGLLSHG
jgi:hypothetical protein